MNKILATIGSILLLGTSVLAYTFYQASRTNEQQLADYTKQLDQLLFQVEINTQLRLDYQKQIDQLKQELLLSKNRIKILDTELDETLQQVNPDYVQIEQQLRNRISAEYQAQHQTDNQFTATMLIQQLSDMDAEERMAVITVQAQYSDFLDTLGTNSQRKQQITQALIEVTLAQSQERQNLFSQGLDPRQLRSQLMTIISPEATRNALAFELTEEELKLFQQYQQNQGSMVAGTVGANGVYMLRGGRPGGGRRRGGDNNVNSGDNTQPDQPIIIQRFQAEPGQQR